MLSVVLRAPLECLVLWREQLFLGRDVLSRSRAFWYWLFQCFSYRYPVLQNAFFIIESDFHYKEHGKADGFPYAWF
jgi:hypothetical protein